jgi:hypothetical protein
MADPLGIIEPRAFAGRAGAGRPCLNGHQRFTGREARRLDRFGLVWLVEHRCGAGEGGNRESIPGGVRLIAAVRTGTLRVLGWDWPSAGLGNEFHNGPYREDYRP